MPVIKSAIKKLRKDRRRERENDARRASLERAIRQAKKSPSKINEAFQALDRAVKRNIIHKNKAARIKSSLSKLTKPTTRATKEPISKTAVKVKKSKAKTTKK